MNIFGKKIKIKKKWGGEKYQGVGNFIHLCYLGLGGGTDVYEKYQQYVVGEEQADWTGLTMQVRRDSSRIFQNFSVDS